MYLAGQYAAGQGKRAGRSASAARRSEELSAEMASRSAFVRDLVFSTLLPDS